MAQFTDVVCLDGTLKLATDQAEKLFSKYKQANNTFYVPSLKNSLAIAIYYSRQDKLDFDTLDQLSKADLRRYTDWVEDKEAQSKQEKNKQKSIKKKAKELINSLSKFEIHWYNREETCKRRKKAKSDFMAQIRQLSDRANVQLYDLFTMTKDEIIQINKEHSDIIESINTIFRQFFPK